MSTSKKKPRLTFSSGQILVGAIMLLLILAILVPVMVMYVRNEARWTVKQQKNTSAFHLAEAATERGYWKIIQSTAIVNSIPVAGYKFDMSYSDIPGGTYAVNIGSDSSKNIIITGVGRDALGREVRAVEVIYAPGASATDSMFSVGINEIIGSENIEWGPIYTKSNLSGNAPTWPRLYASGTIPTYCPSCAGTPPCTDSVHYWCCSCNTVKELPPIDFAYYKALAQGYGTAPAGCNTTTSGGSDPTYYKSSGGFFRGCQDTSGKVYYVEDSDITFEPGGGVKNFIRGTVILAKASTIHIQGSAGSGSYTASVPPYAWREYGLNATTWAHYRTVFDPAAPATFPGINGTYQSTATYTFAGSNVIVQGFVYDGGDIDLSGGGSTIVHGSLYTASGITGNGNFTLYYDTAATAGLKLTATSYTRTSWKDKPSQGWPSGL